MTLSFSKPRFQVHENQIIVDAREFQSWRVGLPEWVKNSSDAYDREGTASEDRVIVVVFSPKEASTGKPALACLDFVGVTSADLEGKLAYYGDPQAAGQGAHVVGGHGNGGKLFAVGGFERGVVWHTVRHGVASEYGLHTPKKPALSFRLDDMGNEFRDTAIAELASTLDLWLAKLGIRIAHLPEAARRVAQTAHGCTLVVGSEHVNLAATIDASILQALASHPQMKTPLETARVFVISSGKILN